MSVDRKELVDSAVRHAVSGTDGVLHTVKCFDLSPEVANLRAASHKHTSKLGRVANTTQAI